ncbi:ATP-binding cassette domain-containing protein [Pseudomonas asplenii]|uniref:ATP-binding cassette domain-containing protein n=1 Tax=Pseudomonas asplenii TaxID=53407 RepID=UPI0006B5D69C|nr:AAA family ATPase [Pseudomonas fuscovaginae]KPA95208.1 ABC-type multidrug transport system, ATPase component [Pseudomonas fuscovaginae]
MTSLQANLLSFNYENKVIFKEASLTAEAGAITGLLGSNGSGKTTFFDIICKLRKPARGKVINTFAKQLYLSQILTTPPALRMFDIFRMTNLLCSSKQISQAQVLSRLSSWSPSITERYQEIWKKKSSLCSYGEKRWFFTLSLLSIEADLIILDEPTAGVDPEFRHYIWQCLHGAAQNGKAILVSSHNVNEIAEHCDCFYMISHKQFRRFADGQSFRDSYSARTLDEAFINAAAC